MTITYSKNSVVEFAVRFIGKPCVYIDNGLEFDTVEDEIVWKYVTDELVRLYSHDMYLTVVNTVLHGGLIAFDTEKEQEELYSIFTSQEVHASGIYAVAFDKDGNAMDENT